MCLASLDHCYDTCWCRKSPETRASCADYYHRLVRCIELWTVDRPARPMSVGRRPDIVCRSPVPAVPGVYHHFSRVLVQLDRRPLLDFRAFSPICTGCTGIFGFIRNTTYSVFNLSNSDNRKAMVQLVQFTSNAHGPWTSAVPPRF